MVWRKASAGTLRMLRRVVSDIRDVCPLCNGFGGHVEAGALVVCAECEGEGAL